MVDIIRLLKNEDRCLFDQFLSNKSAEAYYLRSNAIKSGLEYQGKFYQAEYLGAFKDNKLIGVMAYTWLNSILMYSDDPITLTKLANALNPYLIKRGGEINAILGIRAQVEIVITALQIPPDSLRRRGDDGLFKLDIGKLKAPQLLHDPSYTLRRAVQMDFDLIVRWRVAFNIEAIGSIASNKLTTQAETEVKHRLEIKDLFLLEYEERPVAMCGAGGYIEDIIHIGPVWTPPELRGRGYAKAVTAGTIGLLLSERPKLKFATLFAIRPDAVSAYTSLGFRKIADWALVSIKESFRVLRN